MDDKTTVESTQEQAIASWINHQNQIRLDQLTYSMRQQDLNLESALLGLDATLNEINDLVASNRGGTRGLHGFIAEVAEVGIGNARNDILGKQGVYTWVNNNGAVDLIRDGVDIQQKFYNSGLPFKAMQAHLNTYPDFLANGGKYQIPKDQYEKISYLLTLSSDEANKLPTTDGGFSLKQWKEVQLFFQNDSIKFSSIEPSILDYKDVQVYTANSTIEAEKSSILQTDEEIRNAARQNAQPTMYEGAKIAATSAAIEGGTALLISIREKKKEGKLLKDFSNDDWKDILSKTGIGALKGGVRGVSIYALTNYTATPAAVANALVTASFGVAEQAHLYRTGQISELDFIESSESLCLDVAISAISSLLGEVLIPVPVLGAVIGNSVGTIVYKITKDNLKRREIEIIEGYIKSLSATQDSLDKEYSEVLARLKRESEIYLEIIECLYSVDPFEALTASVVLATNIGIPTDEILDTEEKINHYFVD